MKILILFVMLLIASQVLSQEVSLDNKIYWSRYRNYAVLTVKVDTASMGKTLKVFLWKLEKNVKTAIIDRPVNTVKPKTYPIRFDNLTTGLYVVEVYLGKNLIGVKEMTVVKN